MALSIARGNFVTYSAENLEDKYLKQAKLGEGAVGTVFLSKHKETNDIRAIKHIPKSSIKHPERLKNEVSTLISCDHPHIIKIFEIIEDHENLYLIMEHCKGGELFDYILNNKTIQEAEAAMFFRQIMLAINYLHNKNIVHRDLKPENLMFSDMKTLKLIDFGIAKALKTNETMSTRAGTPFYMSPEILKGHYNISTDIWSAGVVLYIMLCGYPPFYAESDTEIFKKILIGNFSFRGHQWHQVSNRAKDLIRNMLIVNTDLRFTSSQILEHSWLQNLTPSIPFPLSTPEVVIFTKSNFLRRVFLFCIASHINEESYSQVRDAFLCLDQDFTGSLSITTLQERLELQFYNENPDYLKEFVFAMDLNNNGKIEYTEFIAGFLQNSMFFKQEKIIQIFNIFDKHGKGKILPEDLQRLFENPNKKNLDFYEEIFKEANCVNNAGISLEEFFSIIIANGVGS
ncbi:hypothetical protein SteCoe_23215 [Stentor coeruleus]|uniref:non-specific serine/threonine protein kinase n=1 Tax=Stentor coeruleus TaxID=5963 RepID=A0A1R2BKG4_9CILI|nr:hypothetical protein SteCoe_23215 [Stentor coeruleus]